MPRYNPLLDNLPTYPAVRLDEMKAEVLASGKRVFDFGTGDPHEPTAEFIRQACLGAIRPHLGYPSVSGKLEHRTAITDYVARRFGVQLDPATQVIPTAGSKEAVFHTPLLVIDPDADDKLVVFPDPGYPAYQRGALFAGGEGHAHILGGDFVFRPWELAPELLKRTRMMWLNSPHNPSGATMSLEDLQRTAELCREYDILCVNDETYADVYDPDLMSPPHSLLEAGVEGMLVLHSLSKRSGMTGYRSGFLAGDPTIIARLKRLRANPGLAPQDFVNAAMAAAWGDDEHPKERCKVFNAKRKLFLDFFAEAGIEVVGGESTIYLWLKAPEGLDDETWAMELLGHGLLLSPGRIFGVAGGGIGYVRLALVPTIEECREAIAHWKSIL